MATFNTVDLLFDPLTARTGHLRSWAMWLVFVLLGIAPSTSLAQTQRVYLRNSQSNPGTGGIVRDLLPTQGSAGTVSSNNTSSTTFSERLAFTIDHADLTNAVGGSTFNVSVNVTARSSSMLSARFRLQRTNNSGAVQASSEYSDAFNSIGIRTAAFTLPQDWGPGDRLRLSVEVRSTLGSNRNITVSTGNANSWISYVPLSPCSGLPTPGNTLSSTATACSGVPFSLSLQNTTAGSGVGYQWESSFNGSDWSIIPGATSSGFSTSLTATTWYRCEVTCQSNIGLSQAVQVPLEICYCGAQALDNSYERITLVQAADIYHPSTANLAFEDHTAVVGRMVAGSTYPINVQFGWAQAPIGYNVDQVLVWIDLNRNGSFADTGELVYQSQAGQSPRTGTITIPAGAAPGNTRMRVRLHDVSTGQYQNTPNATSCGNSTYGQVEDYTVNIVPPVVYSAGSGPVNDAIWAFTPSGVANGASLSADTKAVIQAGDTVTVSNSTYVGDLEVEQGGTLIIAQEQLLVVNGTSVILNGSVQGLGELSLEGTASKTLSTTGIVDINDLSVSVVDGITVQGTFRIRGTLLLSNGAFDATNATIVLRSTSTSTGRLGPVAAGASYIGVITAQRRVPGGVTNWRLLGSPVDGMTIADWNDDFFTAGFPGSNYPNFYSGGVLWPSIRLYDEAVTGADEFDGLIGVSGTAQTLERGLGYAVWSGDAAGGTQAFVVDVTGAPTIAHSPITLPMNWTNTGNSEVDGLNLVSNPLPSPIAFSQVARGADVENAYWIYNPTNGNNASWNGMVGTNGANGIIQSSQGFWLKAKGPALTTTVSESAKVAGNTGGLFGGPVQLNEMVPMLRLKVSSGMNTFIDEAVVVFQGGTPSFEAGDVEKFVFSHPNAPQIRTRSSDGRELSINMYGPFDSAISIPVRVNVPINGTFTITATELNGVDGSSCLHLEDLETGTITALSEGATYSFTMQANPAATVARFVVHATAPVQYELSEVSCFGADNGEATVILPAGMQSDVTWMDAFGNVLSVQTGVSGSVTQGGLASGNYMASISSEAGCGALVHSFIIAEPFALEASYNTTDATCPDAYDGSISVDVFGGTAPYSYVWSNGGNGSIIDAAVGGHTVLISDANGCTLASDVLQVGSGVAPNASFNLEDPMVMAGEPAAFLNTSGEAANYMWDLGDGNTSTLAEPVHVYSIPGVYTVVLTVSNGTCTSTYTQDVTVQVSTGIGAASTVEELRAWTSQDAFMVELPSDLDVVSIRLHDAAGILHRTSTIQASKLLRIPTDGFSSGIWFLTVETGTYQKTIRLPLFR
jgi:hypothetical protein